MQRKARAKNKYSSSKAERDAGSDVSLWCENVVQSGEIDWKCHWWHKHWKTEGEWKAEGKFYIPFFAQWVLPAPHMIYLFLWCIFIQNIYLNLCTIHRVLGFTWSLIVLFPFVSDRKRPLIGSCFSVCVVACDWPMSCHLRCLHGPHHFRRDKTIKKITTHDPSLVEWLNFKSFLGGKDFVPYTGTTYNS